MNFQSDGTTNTANWFTCSSDITCATDTNSTLTLTTDNNWFPYYQEPTWLPYHCKEYIPKWHIAQGYKNQIKTMWD